MNNCYPSQTAANGGSGGGNETVISGGSYITNKPFTEWANWSHSWEGTKTYGFTAGKYKDGLYPGQTAQQADERAMKGFWSPNNLNNINDPSVAIACMWCVFWTGNMHLVYQAVENPTVYGGRPERVPKGHALLNQDIINKINQIDSLKMFKRIKKQLGWFTVKSMSSKYHKGLIRRWLSINFHQELLKNEQCSKTMNSDDFLNMIEKIDI